ncbi:MAG TPA: adenosylcobalamin-dependent ribonucleoside-diphosphate reductase [Candidatus Binatia bacterium]
MPDAAPAQPPPPMRFGETAIEVLRQRYLQRDDSGAVIETPEGMFERVAAAVARPAEQYGEDAGYWHARFYHRLRRLEFLPNSPTLMNAGLPNGQLAACFVLPVEDDLEAIFAALSQMARIHQSGGGTGFSFSRLRPREDRVRSTGGVTSGPLSFMDLFDHTTAVIRQGGRRRGANMAALRIDHPDIEEFIAAKKTGGRLENFNLSVAVTDAFWSALAARQTFPLRNPRSGAIVRYVKAHHLFDQIVESAWAVGDPGLLFIDEINRANPTPALGAIESTNPCGEQPLLPYESCTLGSLNLGAFVAAKNIDWQRLAGAIDDAVVFLDNVIDANHYPFPAIEAVTKRTRKIGLGVMGLADLLARLGLPYDSAPALQLAEKIAKFLSDRARSASIELAQRRGSFPAFAESLWPRRGFQALRNAGLTCVAPTGTISLIAGASSAIEPYFALALSRRLLDGQTRGEINALVETELATMGALGIKALEAVKLSGSLKDLRELPEELRRRFPIAREISPEYHLRMQAAFQNHVDAAVSKTVNLSSDSAPAVVKDIFMRAHDLRLKGITVYRYGCRPGQALSLIGDSAQADCRECAV